MEKETETLDSPNEETTAEAAPASDTDNLDATALRERLKASEEKNKTTEENNRKLFARAKKAEGFELKDGEWVKLEATVEKKPEPSKENKSELDYGEKAFLAANDVKGTDEIELFLKTRDKFKDDTSMEEVLTDAGFIKAITDRREEKKSTDALEGTADSKRSGTGGSKNQVDYWLNKGDLPPDTPENRQLRRDVVNAQGTRLSSDKRFADKTIIGHF